MQIRSPSKQSIPVSSKPNYGCFPRAAGDYVNRVGQNIMAIGLSRSPSDFTVTLLNSPVNAPAIPGGYVYVTRQLMALMNDEAELAGCWGTRSPCRGSAQQNASRRRPATRFWVCWARCWAARSATAAACSAVWAGCSRTMRGRAPARDAGLSCGQELEADPGRAISAQRGIRPAALSTMLASLANQTSSTRGWRAAMPAAPRLGQHPPRSASRVRNAQALAASADRRCPQCRQLSGGGR